MRVLGEGYLQKTSAVCHKPNDNYFHPFNVLYPFGGNETLFTSFIFHQDIKIFLLLINSFKCVKNYSLKKRLEKNRTPQIKKYYQWLFSKLPERK